MNSLEIQEETGCAVWKGNRTGGWPAGLCTPSILQARRGKNSAHRTALGERLLENLGAILRVSFNIVNGGWMGSLPAGGRQGPLTPGHKKIRPTQGGLYRFTTEVRKKCFSFYFSLKEKKTIIDEGKGGVGKRLNECDWQNKKPPSRTDPPVLFFVLFFFRFGQTGRGGERGKEGDGKSRRMMSFRPWGHVRG